MIITIGAVSASDNSTIEDSLQTNDSVKTFEDIQNEITKAEINSTILLNDSYHGPRKEILIDKDITLDGSGTTTLDAHQKSNILTINANNVILKNINFINAKSPTKGGAINETGKLTIINCSFINNTVNDGQKYNTLTEEFYYGVSILAEEVQSVNAIS